MAGDDRQKLADICNLTFKEQAVWFLNSFWKTHQGEAEKLWSYVAKAASLDVERKDAGNALDELNAHRLLEIFDETLTVREMRTQLRSVGAMDEGAHPKNVPLAHLLLARYKADWHHFVNAPQGASEEIDKAQAKLEECKAAFEESNARAAEAAAALRAAEAREAEARAREADALAREAEAREAEAPFKAAQEEVEAALAEVHKQEAEYHGKIADAKRRSEEGGVVARNKAANELAQLQAEDPLPLRKAKITLEAANKRAEKARAPFLEATSRAEAARLVATSAAEEAAAARRASAVAKEHADAALARAEAALAEAEAFLAQVQATAEAGRGALWWIERELHEQRKYLPTSRGGIVR